ncbi:MAG: carotenoid biosynthesis protein [bacterium]
MDTLITTIIKRPYVVLFLLSYIIIATRVVNWRWMLLFLFSGYTIAFLSEYLSINYGFPYGWYFYKYENLQGEWLNNGVPVWDSVSYVFMCFAGLYLAYYTLRLASSPSTSSGSNDVYRLACENRFILVLLSALFVTILDIIIDPISHMGKRWFLGEIYYYPDPGFYFDITMANFAGWFLVSALINSVGVFILKFPKCVSLSKINNFLSLGLYFGIFGFGLVITIYLHEWALLLCDIIWLLLVIYFVFIRLTRCSK